MIGGSVSIATDPIKHEKNLSQPIKLRMVVNKLPLDRNSCIARSD